VTSQQMCPTEPILQIREQHLRVLREEFIEFNCHFKLIECGNSFLHQKWLSDIRCLCIYNIPTSTISMSAKILVLKLFLWSFRPKFITVFKVVALTHVQMSLSSQQTKRGRSQDYLRALSRHMLYDCL
jgi:hypothetical protein